MNELINISINLLLIVIFGGFCFVVGKAYSESTRDDSNFGYDDYFESVNVLYTSKDKKEIAILLDEWRKKNGV